MLTMYDQNNPLKVAELFVGYGATRLGLDLLKERHPEFCYQVVAISDIDRYALQAYQMIHGECPNWGDVCQIDWEKFPDADLITWSWPCTSISVSGKREGMEEGSGTASSLAFEAIKCFQIKRPKYLLAENVPAIYHGRNKKAFDEILSRLEEIGYANFHGILDASDFGVPQARKRFYMLSILKDDANPHPAYEMPIGEPTELCMLDMIEDMDEKYFLDQERVDKALGKLPVEKVKQYVFDYLEAKRIANGKWQSNQ